MVLSNEPGYYKEDGYGIRCENLVIVVERDDGMLAFETITFVPFDPRLIETSMLSEQELNWLNSYHSKVRDKLSPGLSGDDLSWLSECTEQIDSAA
jgi:Xaa-Pro aminopeptidase